MSLYNFFGTLNTLFIVFSLFGVWSQLRKIWCRKQNETSRNEPTQLLSLNQFTVSYLAYLSFFVYGYSIEPFNHFIVWPRLLASLLVALIVYEIWLDRKTPQSVCSLTFVGIGLTTAMLGLMLGEPVIDHGKIISTSLILVVSAFIAQGYYHQIQLIRKSGKTGAIDLRMSQFILMMDISTIAFACSMGLQKGWPLLVLAITSGITKLIIMYLFHWVKISPKAKLRRQAHQTA